jgi:large subunit ribosomal protein L30
MILVIRISGMVNVPDYIAATLDRMRLRRKYVAVLLRDNVENRKLVVGVRDFVAYGKVDHAFIEKLISVRGEGIDGKKVDAKKISAEVGKKRLEELGIKPFFRLHPPRGGIESKKHFGVGKGVLGDHGEKIKLFVERML